MAAEAQVDASVGAHDTDGRERQVIVDGFEERGGILKLKQLQQEEERAGYEPWNQTRAWFNSAGKSEKRAHSNYFEVREHGKDVVAFAYSDWGNSDLLLVQTPRPGRGTICHYFEGGVQFAE